MKHISRRKMLATTGGLLTAAAVARAQQDATAASSPGPRRHRSRSAQPRAGPAESRYPGPAVHRSRHAAEPALLILRRARAADDRRLDPSGDRARARRLDDHRRREHAPECRRRPRAALAQGQPNGRTCCTARARITAIDRAGTELRRRRRRRRSVVLPIGHSALDPGTRSGRLRVPAGLRRRHVRRRQHLPDQRLVQAHAERRPGQELRRAGVARSATRRTRASATSSRRPSRDRSPPTRSPAPRRCRRASAIG